MEQSLEINQFLDVKRKPVTRKERWAWYFYDFGNSGYAAVVLLAVYSAYFKTEVVGGATGSRLWGFSVGIAMLVTALISPILGALADFTAAKKRFLFIFSSMSIFFTAMLFFVDKGDIFTGMLFFILAEIGYRGGQVFYNSLLPDIAEKDELGRVSGNGWAFGSLGGIICLLIVLPLIVLLKGTFVIRICFLITALFYLLSSLPIYIFVNERTKPQRLPAGETYISIAFKHLAATWKSAGQYKQFILFVAAFLIFNNAIMMTMDFAGIIGSVLFQMKQTQLIIFMIIVQVTSVAGAFILGRLTARIGSKRALIFSIIGMIGAVSLIFVAQSLPVFYLTGALAGFALTGVQSVSRTSVGQMAPDGKSAEFYGIHSLAGQLSNFTGPTIYGMLATSLALSRERAGIEPIIAEQLGMRGAVIAMVVFLAVGLLMLIFLVRNWQTKAKAVSSIKTEVAEP
jgi:UMF1 family MFS transporter